AVHEFALPGPLLDALREVGRGDGATLYMVLLAAFQLLLWRYSGDSAIVVGSPIAGRMQREVEGLIGFFANTLALRTDLAGWLSFGDLLRRVRATVLDGFRHQDLPFEKLVEELNPVRDMARHPVFQVLFAFESLGEVTLALPGLTLSMLRLDDVTAKFDLSL